MDQRSAAARKNASASASVMPLAVSRAGLRFMGIPYAGRTARTNEAPPDPLEENVRSLGSSGDTAACLAQIARVAFVEFELDEVMTRWSYV